MTAIILARHKLSERVSSNEMLVHCDPYQRDWRMPSSAGTLPWLLLGGFRWSRVDSSRDRPCLREHDIS